MDTPENNPAPTPDQPQTNQRRWPRRVAIGLVATGVIVGGTLWYLGRETTLQMIAQRVASATGGKLTLTGVSGTLYGKMHIERLIWRTDEQVITANKIDIDWSPGQVLSGGILIDQLWAASVK
jgi:translocation and assembly module TamB